LSEVGELEDASIKRVNKAVVPLHAPCYITHCT